MVKKKLQQNMTFFDEIATIFHCFWFKIKVFNQDTLRGIFSIEKKSIFATFEVSYEHSTSTIYRFAGLMIFEIWQM